MTVPRFLIPFLLLSAVPAHAGAIPDTGQTTCYNDTAAIACPAPGQDFYGQDGNFSINPRSYTKLDSSGLEVTDDRAWAMVRDNVTGLVWENKTNDGTIHDRACTYAWGSTTPAVPDANATSCGGTNTAEFIQSLNERAFGGFTDWRLPTLVELVSIVDFSRANPAINQSYFPNVVVVPSYYWSSSPYAVTKAWTTDFYGNFVNSDADLSSSHLARAVRSGTPPIRAPVHWIDNGDGTTTDTVTGLMWQQEASSAASTWEAALAYVAAKNAPDDPSSLGYGDWRLPTLTELLSIADFGRTQLAVDTALFHGPSSSDPETEASSYWSSTTAVNPTAADAWFVSFYVGIVYSGGKVSSGPADLHFVRPVRGGQVRVAGRPGILAPQQGEVLYTGETRAIAWETAGFGDNVKITLSRQGGKSGTFSQVIDDAVPNSGSHAWIVAGPGSQNCVLKVESASGTGTAATQGLFSIMEVLKGDLDNSGTVTLADAVGALQIASRQAPPAERKLYLGADVNGDRRIGLAEAIYTLQSVAEIRPAAPIP